MWYPGNPVTAGKFGLSLVWPGPIPQDAYDLYVNTWNQYKGSAIRADGPGDVPRVGTSELLGISHDEIEAKAIAARGYKGLFRRIANVHTFDSLVLDEFQAEAALNPLALGAQALTAPGGDVMLPYLTQKSGTPAQVAEHVQQIIDDGRSEYIILQLPTGDMTFKEAMSSLDLFITDVMPCLKVPVH